MCDESPDFLVAKPEYVTGSDVFAMARTSFLWLVTGPDPVSVDGREIPGLPARPVPLDELGALLPRAECAQATRDAAWAYLITRARAEGGMWTVACVGLGLPILLSAARSVTRHFHGDKHDLNVAVLTGFLQGLRDVDPSQSAVLASLYWSAYREGLLALGAAVNGPIPVEDEWLEAWCDPFEAALISHDERPAKLLLAEAVKDGVITVSDAELIFETRVGDTTVSDAALARDLQYLATYVRRARAENRLASYLTNRAGTPSRTPASRGRAHDGNSLGAGAADATSAPGAPPGRTRRAGPQKAAGGTAMTRHEPLSFGPASRNATHQSVRPEEHRSRPPHNMAAPAALTRTEVC